MFKCILACILKDQITDIFVKDDDFYKILPTQDDREAYKSIIKNQNSREFDNKTIYLPFLS